MTNNEAIRIIQMERDHCATHNRDAGMSKEYHKEMQNLVDAFDFAIKALEDRPQGEWVGIIDHIKHLEETTGEKYLVNSTYYDQELYCNRCWEMHTRKTKFCPNCGADMRGDEK